VCNSKRQSFETKRTARRRVQNGFEEPCGPQEGAGTRAPTPIAKFLITQTLTNRLKGSDGGGFASRSTNAKREVFQQPPAKLSLFSYTPKTTDRGKREPKEGVGASCLGGGGVCKVKSLGEKEKQGQQAAGAALACKLEELYSRGGE